MWSKRLINRIKNVYATQQTKYIEIIVSLMLVHRIRRWNNVEPTLIQRLVSAEWSFKGLNMELSRGADRLLVSSPRILLHVTIYRRLRIGRDGPLDQYEAYDIS